MALFVHEANGRGTNSHSICDAPLRLPTLLLRFHTEKRPTLYMSEYDGQTYSVLALTMMALLLSLHHTIASLA